MFIESFYPKLIYEIGLFGAIAFLAVTTILTYTTFQIYRSLQNSTFKNYALCLWMFILFISFNPYYYPLDTEPVAVYYWFFAGVVLALPTLD
ncbi:MAG: hypothetical protein HC840_16070 [Leptolyngbyaceae cyanobacterium RM2_2_4]|nr:hypothetical protein [Leptolyngbyaceae cyanobacterium RM2_2_4]